MIQNRLPVSSLIATLAILGFSSAGRADSLYVDDGSQINVYDLSLASPLPSTYSSVTAGAQVKGLAVSYASGAPVLLAAATGLSDILDFSSAGSATDFSVTNPIGLAVDAAGDVYTGANNGAKVQEFSSAGALLSTIASGGGLQAQSVAVDASGDVFYADNHTGNVVEHTSSGNKTIATNLNGSNFYGLALDNAGDVFVSFWSLTLGGSNGIFEITPTGSLSTFYTAAANVLPTGLAVDPGTGNLYMTYVTSSNGNSGGADVFTNTGGTLSATPTILAAAGSLNSPFGVAIVTPEPGTVLMLTGGLLSIALLRFRRAI